MDRAVSDTADTEPEYEADSLTKAGAQHTAARLQAYWHAQGHKTVRHWVEHASGTRGGGHGIYVVRSNLVRGLPPR
jgi:hypothetical protein